MGDSFPCTLARTWLFTWPLVLIVAWPGEDGIAWAVVDSQTGAAGTNGAAGGSGDPGTAGGNGADGGSATANGASGDTSNSGLAKGGRGGDGGQGGNGVDGPDDDSGANAGNGGMGGNGGAAEATATTSGGDAAVAASAGASGGNGGKGGDSGTPQPPGVAGTAGKGGVGGGATASASASNTNSDAVIVTASVLGGSGGRGGGGDIPTADGGDAGRGTLGSIVGTSEISGFVSVQGAVEGGAGGGGRNGGKGAEASVIDAVNGTTRGDLSLVQIALGGPGGDAFSGSPGQSGDATSSLTRLVQAESLTLESSATGGRGALQFGDGSAGSGAIGASLGVGTNETGRATVTATGHGGDGGSVIGFFSGGGGSGGEGGARSHGFTSIGGHPLSVNAIGIGGPGGDGGLVAGRGGNGGNAVAEATGTAPVDSFITVMADAFGGDGGDAFGTSEQGGDGGDARATVEAINGLVDGISPIRVHANAFGGYGGAGSEDIYLGVGGDATASASGTGVGPVIATASATGGAGGALSDIFAGAATAHAFGKGRVVTAGAMTHGFDGMAVGIAESKFDLITLVHAEAMAPTVVLAQRNDAEGRTSVGHAAPTQVLARNLHAAAYGTGLPSLADVAGEIAGDPQVQAAFDVGGNSRMLGLVVLGAAYPDDGEIMLDEVYRSKVEFDIDVSTFTHRDLLKVGLLDPMFSGEGFDMLRFILKCEGMAVVDMQFDELADAMEYFDDRVLDLGAIRAGVVGDLDLDFSLELTSSDPGEGFNFNLVAGANIVLIPEPASVTLLGLCLALVGSGRSKGIRLA